MAAVLTTIYAEVVKTAAIRKFSRPQCAPAFTRLARFAVLAFGILFAWGFAEASHLWKSFEGFREDAACK